MANLQHRPPQTKVKHVILEEYLHRWGSIITMGLKTHYEKLSRQSQDFRATLVYIDPFSFTGRYADEDAINRPVYGSPVIGIRALDSIKHNAKQRAGFQPEVITVLIEREKTTHEILLQTLNQAGYTERVKHVTDFNSLRDGDIAIVHGNFHKHVDRLLEFTGQKYFWALYFLDPYGASGIPIKAICPIISQPHNDVIINLPYLHLQRRLHPTYLSALYGDQNWKDWIRNVDAPQEKEAILVGKYERTLQACDPDLVVKLIPLLFPDKDRTMFYLVLTTHDPTGALAINEILDDAKLQEYNLRIQWKIEKYRRRTGQSELFDLGTVTAPPPKLKRPSIAEIAERIYDLCKGQTVTFREVLKRVVNEPYYHHEIKKAMTRLKRSGRAEYARARLRNPDEVTFI